MQYVFELQNKFDDLKFKLDYLRAELDKKTETLKDSEFGLEAVREYLSNLIENKEKKSSKSSDYVKIHETEKNNYSLLCTSRRCKLLQESLPSSETDVQLKINSMNKSFVFKIGRAHV